MITQRQQAQLSYIKEVLLKINVQGLNEVTLDPTNKQLILRFDTNTNGALFSDSYLSLFGINEDYFLLGNELSIDITLEDMHKAIGYLAPKKNLIYAPDNRLKQQNNPPVELMNALNTTIAECKNYLLSQETKQTSRGSFLHRAVSINRVDEKKKEFVEELKINLENLFRGGAKAFDILNFIDGKLAEPDNPAFKLIFGKAGVSPVKKLYEDAKNLVNKFLPYDKVDPAQSIQEIPEEFFQDNFEEKKEDKEKTIQPVSDSASSASIPITQQDLSDPTALSDSARPVDEITEEQKEEAFSNFSRSRTPRVWGRKP